MTEHPEDKALWLTWVNHLAMAMPFNRSWWRPQVLACHCDAADGVSHLLSLSAFSSCISNAEKWLQRGQTDSRVQESVWCSWNSPSEKLQAVVALHLCNCQRKTLIQIESKSKNKNQRFIIIHCHFTQIRHVIIKCLRVWDSMTHSPCYHTIARLMHINEICYRSKPLLLHSF